MAMRLLPKSEISMAKASAKRQEIDQGMKMAKRIDATRETLAQEEQKLETFRSTTVSAIHKEIAEAGRERDKVLKQVEVAREERKKLLVPLNAEWEDIAKAKKQLAHDTANAQSLAATTQEADRQVQIAVRQTSNALARALTREEASHEKLRTISAADKEAKRALRNAEKVESETLALRESVEADLKHRSAELAAKERGYTMRSTNLQKGEDALAKGWKLLEDRKKAFERQITRAKK